MVEEIQHSLIITVVNRGFSDSVIDAARSAGAQGTTVLYARGTGIHEMEKFFSIAIQPEKEVVLTLVENRIRSDVMKAICCKAGLSTQGNGLSFSVPADDIAGIVHLDR